MEAGSTEDKRLVLMEARAAIADLVHGYARDVRAGRGADCAQMFTDDPVFEVRDAPPGGGGNNTRARLEGRDAIMAYVAHSALPGARVCPSIHHLIVQVNGRDVISNCAMTTLLWPVGNTIVGEYHDSYRKEGEVWQFFARVFTILGEFGDS